jgi:5'-3' exonuclease
MGVKGLYTYLKGYRRNISVELLAKEPKLRIGFDAMSMLYKYKSAFEEMYPSLLQLKEQGHTLLFVFDGKTPKEKEAEVKGRREIREGAVTQANAIKQHLNNTSISDNERKILEYSMARLEYQGWHMSHEIRDKFKKELVIMQIPYVKAIQEADDVLTDLAVAGKLDIVVSTDMDFIISGVKRQWIPSQISCNTFEEIHLEEILEGEGLTKESLLDAGILSGVEPLRGLLSINPIISFSWMRYYKSIEKILESSVENKQLEILKDKNLLDTTRNHFEAKEWTSRIHPEHLETYKSFLNAL